jgi:hypothetical protein
MRTGPGSAVFAGGRARFNSFGIAIVSSTTPMHHTPFVMYATSECSRIGSWIRTCGATIPVIKAGRAVMAQAEAH